MIFHMDRLDIWTLERGLTHPSAKFAQKNSLWSSIDCLSRPSLSIGRLDNCPSLALPPGHCPKLDGQL